MIKTIADQYLAQNAGRRYPFRDDTELPDWLTDAGVLDFRCTLFDAPAGTVPEARMVRAEYASGGDVRFTVALSVGGTQVDTLLFLVPDNISNGTPYTVHAAGDRSHGTLTLTGAAIPPPVPQLPYDAEVGYVETDGLGAYINTGITPDTTSEIHVGFQVVSVPRVGNESSNYNCVWGACSTNSAWTARLVLSARDGGSGSFYPALPALSAGTTNPAYDHNVHDVSFKSGEMVWDGVSLGLGNFNSTNIGNFCLGSRGTVELSSNPQYGYTQTRFYSCKIYTNNVLVFDGIPVSKDRQGYIYDRVSERLCGNAGAAGTAVTYGANVSTPSQGTPSGVYAVDVPFAATTVVCDSLKVMSLQSGHASADALDKDDPAGRNAATVLTGEIVLAEGRNTEPYLDGNHVRLDIFKGAGLGENCQAVGSSQRCDNVLFTINGERPGSDGDIHIVGEDGITVTPDPGAHALTIKMDTVARDRMTTECASECSGG